MECVILRRMEDGMNARQCAAALTAAAAMTAGAAFAQTYYGPTYVAPAAVTTPSGAVVSTPSGAMVSTPSGAVVSPAPVVPLETWADDYSRMHDGRITRHAYLDEMARRWDAADINQDGLTPADLSRLTGRIDTNAPVPLSGSGVQSGNMGPGNSKGK